MPSNGTLSAYNASSDTFTYTPNPGFVGKDFFTFQMKDDANTLSEVRTVCIKVLGTSILDPRQKEAVGYTSEYVSLK
jgi:hypothetical protein